MRKMLHYTFENLLVKSNNIFHFLYCLRAKPIWAITLLHNNRIFVFITLSEFERIALKMQELEKVTETIEDSAISIEC